MNWVKTLNDIDKNFYDKCADLAIISLYETEEIMNETMITFQNESIKFVIGEILIEDLQISINNQLEQIQSSYFSNEKKFINLFQLYSKEINSIVETKIISNPNMAIKKIKLSNQKCNSILKAISNELKKLHESLIVDINNFRTTYFKVYENEIAKEKLSKNINYDIGERIEKVKLQYDKIFKQRDIVKYLEENGFTYKNTGRHANYTDGVNTIPVPMHGSKELGYGLQRKIQKEVIEHKNL